MNSSLVTYFLMLFAAPNVKYVDHSSSQELVHIYQARSSDIPVSYTIERDHTWSSSPDIIICTELMMDKAIVVRALSHWEQLGHRFREVSMTLCDSNELYDGWLGAIYFVNPEQNYDFRKLSNSIISYGVKKSGETNIVGSAIMLTYYSRRDIRILIHELGHALGYSHYNIPGHLMNPVLQQIGQSTTGLHVTELSQ